jgi:hypothetical protein
MESQEFGPWDENFNFKRRWLINQNVLRRGRL